MVTATVELTADVAGVFAGEVLTVAADETTVLAAELVAGGTAAEVTPLVGAGPTTDPVALGESPV